MRTHFTTILLLTVAVMEPQVEGLELSASKATQKQDALELAEADRKYKHIWNKLPNTAGTNLKKAFYKVSSNKAGIRKNGSDHENGDYNVWFVVFKD